MSTLHDTAYPLTDEQLHQYRTNHHICLRGVGTGDILDEVRAAIGAHVAEKVKDLPELAERDTYGKAFQQVCNLWPNEETVRTFVLSRRFAGIAAALLGVPAVRIYHDQALFKEAGGGHTPWHQDQHYWPLDCPHTLTMWMPLVPVTKDMGTMHFASGSHEEGYLGDIQISDQSEAYFENFCAERGFEIINHGGMAAGDATFHSGWCWHGAPGNASDRSREVITVIYMPADTTVLPDPDPQDRWNANRRCDLANFLPGCQPGGPADSPLNPRLLPADG